MDKKLDQNQRIKETRDFIPRSQSASIIKTYLSTELLEDIQWRRFLVLWSIYFTWVYSTLYLIVMFIHSTNTYWPAIPQNKYSHPHVSTAIVKQIIWKKNWETCLGYYGKEKVPNNNHYIIHVTFVSRMLSVVLTEHDWTLKNRHSSHRDLPLGISTYYF